VEKPSAYFPFLSWLTSNKMPTQIELSAPEFAGKTGIDGKPIKSKYSDHNPIFTRLLLPNETWTLLETSLIRSRLTRWRGEYELMKMAIAAGQADEVLEEMGAAWSAREEELSKGGEGKPSKRECESWIDVLGHRVCNVSEFWRVVGPKAKIVGGPIKIEAQGYVEIFRSSGERAFTLASGAGNNPRHSLSTISLPPSAIRLYHYSSSTPLLRTRSSRRCSTSCTPSRNPRLAPLEFSSPSAGNRTARCQHRGDVFPVLVRRSRLRRAVLRPSARLILPV
jgi:hypothetical protein